MIVDTHGVVTEIARHRDTAFQFGLNARKQTVCMRVAQLRIVLEHVQSTCRHFTARGGTVVLEHIGKRFPQQAQVIF